MHIAPKANSLCLAFTLLTPMTSVAQEAELAAPYGFRGALAYVVGVTFDGEAVRAALPASLEPAEGFTGGLSIYTTPYGSLAPYTAGYLWIDVAGHDGSDGGAGRYMVRGYYSENFHQAADIAQAEVVLGEGRISEENGTIHAVAGPPGSSVIEIVMTPTTEGCATGLAVVANYLFEGNEEGSAEVMYIPVVLDWCDAEVASVTISAPDDEVLSALVPREILWGGVEVDTSFSFMPAVQVE